MPIRDGRRVSNAPDSRVRWEFAEKPKILSCELSEMPESVFVRGVGDGVTAATFQQLGSNPIQTQDHVIAFRPNAAILFKSTI